MDLKELHFDWNEYNGMLKSFDKSKIIDIMDEYYNSELSVAKIKSKYSIDKNVSLSREFPKIF